MSKTFITVDGLECELVWDGTDEVRIPKAMGAPREDQMRGTACERLTEVAMRVCYDSLGKGRSSEDARKHLLEVRHLNPLEHWQKTIEVCFPNHQRLLEAYAYLAQRPGLWLEYMPSDTKRPPVLRVTRNDRTILDWEWWSGAAGGPPIDPSYADQLYAAVVDTAPAVEPLTFEEKWISIFVQGSRGFSHELVRHRFRTAVSQRSTRYVDESESPWVLHPLAEAWIGEGRDENEEDGTISQARKAYTASVDLLQNWLKKRGIDGTSARKQARGAARGYLGNALLTEMIFSASVAQWKRMIRLRASDAADAEIRYIFAEKVLPALRSSRYGAEFEEFKLGPASDGIGRSLVGGGAR